LFVSCIIHILYTGCAKIKKNNSGAEGLIMGIVAGISRNLHKIYFASVEIASSENQFFFSYFTHYNARHISI